jgi:hypothetical protein
MNLLVRKAMSPQSITSEVLAQISALDADQPVNKIQTVDELIDTSRAASLYPAAARNLLHHCVGAGLDRNLHCTGLLVAQRRQE